MQDRLSEWLREDHATLREAAERAPLTDTVLAKIARRERRKMFVLGAAALTGVMLAASQLLQLQLPELALLHPGKLGLAMPDASLTVGLVLIAATALVFGWGLNER